MEIKQIVASEISKQLRASLCINENTPDDTLQANIELAISRLGIELDSDSTRLIFILAEIRNALGINESVMLSELAQHASEIKLGHDRYEKVRLLAPRRFKDIWECSLDVKHRFDALVDEIKMPN